MKRSLKFIMRLYVLLLVCILCLPGCAEKKDSYEEKFTPAQIPDFQSPARPKDSEWIVAEASGQEPELPQPKFKALSPLDTERVNISVVEERYEQILQVLAHTAALNLIISPETKTALGGSTLLTAEYQDMSIRQVLDSMCRMLNVTWFEESGSLFIEPFISKSIDLDFLGSIRQSAFEVGGDVLGSSGGGEESGGGSSPLSGRFVVEGETTDSVTDIYKNIESSIKQLLNGTGTFVLNRQTGHLLVRSRPAAVAELEEYIQGLREKYRRQVLIEAKIIEVGLGKKYELGIDWRNIGVLLSKTALRTSGDATGTLTSSNGADSSFYSLSIDSKYSNVAAILHALQEYGKLNILSNPRLKTMNGQSAVISVGQSVAYLSSFEQSSEGTGDNRTVEYTTGIGSVFDGVLLGITPIIENNGMITLHIVPIKSDLVKLDEINFGPTFSSYKITLPRVNLREISTVTRVQSGAVVLLGGLIMEYDDNDNSGLPLLQDIPFIGRIFKFKSTEKKHVELVVALKVTAVADP